MKAKRDKTIETRKPFTDFKCVFLRQDIEKRTGFKDLNGTEIRVGDILIPTVDFYGNENPTFKGVVAYSTLDKRFEVFTDHPQELGSWLSIFGGTIERTKPI